MPIAFELDTPFPDDTVGRTFVVGGTYDLGVVPTRTGPVPQVVCVLLDNNGNQAKDSHNNPIPPVPKTLPFGVSGGTWEASFTVDMDYTDYQVTARLEFGTSPYPSDTVENIDIRQFAGADIQITR